MIVSILLTFDIVYSNNLLKTALLLAAAKISYLSNSPSPFESQFLIISLILYLN